MNREFQTTKAYVGKLLSAKRKELLPRLDSN